MRGMERGSMKHDMDYTCFRPDNCGGTCYGCTIGICRKCRQYEGGLATECPGTEVSEEDAQRIYALELNFIADQWRKHP